MIRCRSLALALATSAQWQPGLAQAANPSVAECVTASDDANRLDAEHKLRAERQRLLVCASEGCPDVIREECTKRVEQLNQTIPSVVFQVRDTQGADVGAVKVTMDGELLSERLDGTALPVDPGEHRFTFESRGFAPVTRMLVVRVTEQNRREPIVFAEQYGAPQTTEQADTWSSHRLSSQRVGALIAGSVGLTGVAVGTVFGLQALSKRDDARSVCPDSTCPTPQGAAEWHQAKGAGTLATVAFIIGGVGLAGSAALWFTDNSHKREQPQVGLGIGSIQVRAAW